MASVQCTVCGHDSLERNVSFGEQPLSTRFETAPGGASSPRWPLSLGHCPRCFTIQLVDRFPLSALMGKHPVGRFREPDAHLPRVVATLKAAGALPPRGRIGAFSYIDQDLTRLIEADVDIAPGRVSWFGAAGAPAEAGLETLQARVRDAAAAIDHWAQEQGPLDFACARFLLEHAESAQSFLRSMMRAVKPGGHLLVEVPDVGKTLAVGNHALIWEDHFTYFTPASLRMLASVVGCSVVSLESHPYPYEDALVLVLKVPDDLAAAGRAPSATATAGDNPREALEAFGAGFESVKAALQQEFQARWAQGRRTAVFGAGHHAAKFINFHGIAGCLDFVADDDPAKNGLYVAGTSLAVLPSTDLLSSQPELCLSSLAPAVEAKVRARMPAYFDRGGEFRPMFKTTRESS